MGEGEEAKHNRREEYTKQSSRKQNYSEIIFIEL